MTRTIGIVSRKEPSQDQRWLFGESIHPGLGWIWKQSGYGYQYKLVIKHTDGNERSYSVPKHVYDRFNVDDTVTYDNIHPKSYSIFTGFKLKRTDYIIIVVLIIVLVIIYAITFAPLYT